MPAEEQQAAVGTDQAMEAACAAAAAGFDGAAASFVDGTAHKAESDGSSDSKTPPASSSSVAVLPNDIPLLSPGVMKQSLGKINFQIAVATEVQVNGSCWLIF